MQSRQVGSAQPVAAPSFRTSSVWEAAARLPYLGLDVHLPSPGTGELVLTTRDFGDAGAATMNGGRLVRGRITARPGHWLAAVAVDAPVGTTWDGHPVKPRDVAIIPPRAGLVVVHPPGAEIGVVAARATRLAIPRTPATSAASGRVGRLAGPLPARRIRAVHQLSMDLRRTAGRDKADDIGEALVTAADLVDWSTAGPHQRDALIVAKSLEHLMMESQWKVPLSHLATVTGVSERRVQLAFEAVCGVPPSRYMRARALQAVYERLRRADRQLNISAIALDHGFDHLGRFSAYYRAMFGEQPSVTRRNGTLSAA